MRQEIRLKERPEHCSKCKSKYLEFNHYRFLREAGFIICMECGYETWKSEKYKRMKKEENEKRR